MHFAIYVLLFLELFTTDDRRWMSGVTAEKHSSMNSRDYYLKREHSLLKPYHSSGISIPHWDFSGSTLVTNNYVRLTPNLPGKNGSLWNNVPCFARDWELRVHFKIHGNHGNLYGDGIAIWYTDDPRATGPVFGGKDYFSGLGVFLDTYENHKHQHSHRHPYISAMVNNGTLHYNHDEDGTQTRVAGCSADIRGEDTQISIRYEQRRKLTVSTFTMSDAANDDKGSWRTCFSVDGVRLPTGYSFGVSAKTGDLSDNHDVIAIKMYELPSSLSGAAVVDEDLARVTPSAVISQAPPRTWQEDDDEHHSTGMSALKIFLLTLLAIIGVCLCIMACMVAIESKERNDRKRYY